jgi:2-desacetyl-2-hydroxyethyl bacteriochlorophyllide A dehydrogenase
MKAVIYKGPHNVVMDDIEVPTIGPDEVLIKTKYASICGTDLKISEGQFPAEKGLILGHEASGIVEEVGENVTHIGKGQKAIFEPYLICRRCVVCRSGRYNVCIHRRHMGIEADGVFAEYFKIPGYAVHAMPEGLSLKEAALVEPTSVAYHSVMRLDPVPGDSVVILGAGPIALMAVQSVKAFGSHTIIVTGHHNERLKLAKKFGATRTVNTYKEDIFDVVMEETDGQYADKVLEAVGVPKTIQQSVEIVRTAGRIGMVGISEVPVEFNFLRLVRKEIDIVTSDASCMSYEKEPLLIAKGILNVKDLISRVYPFDDVFDAFEQAKKKEDIKILLKFD